jgi:hypothetical protein
MKFKRFLGLVLLLFLFVGIIWGFFYFGIWKCLILFFIGAVVSLSLIRLILWLIFDE